MAVVMLGGMLGLGGAALAYLALDASLLAALAIWAGSGPVAAGLAIGLALCRPTVDEPPAEVMARVA